MKRHKLLAVLIGLIAIAGWCPAQSPAPKPMTPPLRQVFPIVQTDEGVKLFQTVLLGDSLVLPRGTLLRNLSAIPQVSEESKPVIIARPQLEDSFSKDNRPQSAKEAEAEKRRQAERKTSETAWDSKLVFLEALDFAHERPLQLSYIDPKTQNVMTTPLTFFEGMLLVEHKNLIQVASLDPDGAAATAGFKTGDRILAVNNAGVEGKLDKFVELYQAARSKSGLKRAKVVFSVFRDGKPLTLEISPPLSLKDSFFD